MASNVLLPQKHFTHPPLPRRNPQFLCASHSYSKSSGLLILLNAAELT